MLKSVIEAPIIKGTKVLIRLDLDVPMDECKILETFRLDSALPTLNHIIQNQGFPIILGHIGRPEGKKVESLSTHCLHNYFDLHLGQGNYQLLENVRFDPREKEGSLEFAQKLVDQTKAEIYVNESFATCHRDHTSVTKIPQILPGFAGLQLLKEVKNLSLVFDSPKRPLVAIVGGAKLKSKKPAVQKFINIADFVLVGGKVSSDWDEDVPQNLILQYDYIGEAEDIGPKTIENFIKYIKQAQTIVWAGPLGRYEADEFNVGTSEIAKVIGTCNAYSILGGGDTVAAVKKSEHIDSFDFVSTGGGAMLEFLIEETLVGLQALGY